MILKNGKFIILADIHIDDYPNYRMTPTYRKDQFMTLATDIRDYCIKNDIGSIILAGDTINRAVNAPEVQHLLKNFLKLLSDDSRIQVLHLCGQHDYNCKVSKAKFESTYMNLYPEYTTYVGDGQIIRFGNFTVATRDWVPGDEADTSFITEPVDLFIGHVTNLPVFGQVIDHEKFKLGIVGDIHQQSQYENVINLGTPFYHHKLDEEMDGRFAVVDLTDPTRSIHDSVTFHKIDPTGTKYLKIKVVSDKPAKDREFDPTTNTFYQYIPSVTESTDSEVDVTKLSDTLLTNDQIRAYIDETFDKDPELRSVHSAVIKEVDLTDTKIDLDFRLVSLKIENYRSVRSLYYEFGKTTAVIGAFGSGKSSFINAMKLALTLTKIPESSVSRWADYGEINLVLEYQGNQYTLCVSTGPFAFAINGEWQTCSAKAREKMAREMLPFLNYTDIFIFTTEDSQLLSKMNEDRKSEILSKLYNIDILNAFYDKAAEILYNINQSITKAEADIHAAESVLKMTESSIPEEYRNLSLQDIVSKIDERTLYQDKLNTNYSNIYRTNQHHTTKKLIEDQLATDRGYLESAVARRDALQSEYDSFIANKATYERITSDDKYRTNLADEVTRMYNQCMSLYNELNALTEKYKSDCEALSSAVCPECRRPLTPEQVQEKRTELDRRYQSDYERKNAQYTAQLTSYNAKNEELSSLPEAIGAEEAAAELYTGAALVKSYNELVASIKSYETSITLKEQKLEKLKIEISTIGELFDLGLDTDLQVYSAELAKVSGEIVTLGNVRNTIINVLNSANIINDTNTKLTELRATQKAYQKYLANTSNTSELYRSILQLITDKFSCKQYMMTVETYVSRNQQRLSISMKYLNGNYYFDYADCSTAQKCFCDIYFLSNLLKNSGILIMDEYFKSVPSDAMITMMEILKTLNNNNLVFSSHHDNLIVEGDVLQFELVDNETQITKL